MREREGINKGIPFYRTYGSILGQTRRIEDFQVKNAVIKTDITFDCISLKSSIQCIKVLVKLPADGLLNVVVQL